MRALVVAALFLLASLAVGTAEAAPPEPQCIHGGIQVGVGPATVSTHCASPPTVELDPSCLRLDC